MQSIVVVEETDDLQFVAVRHRYRQLTTYAARSIDQHLGQGCAHQLLSVQPTQPETGDEPGCANRHQHQQWLDDADRSRHPVNPHDGDHRRKKQAIDSASFTDGQQGRPAGVTENRAIQSENDEYRQAEPNRQECRSQVRPGDCVKLAQPQIERQPDRHHGQAAVDQQRNKAFGESRHSQHWPSKIF